MNRPTWVVAVGILGIIFGSFGMIGSTQTILMPTMLKFEKGFFANMEKEMERPQPGYGNATTCQPRKTGCRKPACTAPPPKEMFAFMSKMWEAPEWFDTWCIAAGVIGVFVSGFYIFASIWLLLMRKSAVKLFYFAAGTSVAFSIVKGVVAVMAMTLLGISMLVWSLVGAVLTGVLIIIAATSDKTAFSKTLTITPVP